MILLAAAAVALLVLAEIVEAIRHLLIAVAVGLIGLMLLTVLVAGR
jgi:hypothetical protein